MAVVLLEMELVCLSKQCGTEEWNRGQWRDSVGDTTSSVG